MVQDRADIEALRAREAELERLLAEVREHRAALEKRPKGKAAKPGRPLRDITLEMLEDAGCPLNSLLLASVMRPLQGRAIPATRFGTLSNDEASSYDSSRARPVYLCHGLMFDQGQAVKRFWARSDWPLAERIIGPMSGRILFLKGAAWVIRLAHLATTGQLVADNQEVLNYLAADQARDAGIQVKRGEFPHAAWLDVIKDAIGRHEAEDRAVREKAAEDLEGRLSDREQLFGSRTGLVSLPGSPAAWRSALDER
jgi:hypothetical protein